MMKVVNIFILVIIVNFEGTISIPEMIISEASATSLGVVFTAMLSGNPLKGKEIIRKN